MVSELLALPWLALLLAGFSGLRCAGAFQRNAPIAHRAFEVSASARRVAKAPARSAVKLPEPGRVVVSYHLAATSGEDDGKKPAEMDGVVELPGVLDRAVPVEPLAMSQSQADAKAPFLSQRTELDPDALSLNFSDAKQTRVIVYIVLSLLPVLFLIPFMLGSRDLLPLIEGSDMPPVQI